MKIPIPKNPETLIELVKSIRLIKKFEKEINNLSDKMKELPKSFKSSLPDII